MPPGEGSEITVSGGFVVEKLHDVDPDSEGSWVSLTVDPQGRLIASDQYGKLYRIVVNDSAGNGDRQNAAEDVSAVRVQPLMSGIGSAQGLLYAQGSLYVMVNKERESGLYRLRDTNGDEQFNSVERLLELNGNGEHGPHGLALAPDGQSIYFCCGNHTDVPDLTASRLPRNWHEDLLLPRLWDANGHAAGRMAPGGFICRVDLNGQQCELIAAGFRNSYDLAFNAEGELFTYDSDMEWDIGLPWYRPTRVVHATSGAEFGWRSGSGKWPTYYPDSLPAVVDIGQGSPTGITFGRGTHFPAKYQQALFACDWSYGILYAVHLLPAGASYRGVAERFAFGSPFPVTDIVVRPQDGALYVTVGGRRVKSALYRIRYVGSEHTNPVGETPVAGDLAATLQEASDQRAVRRRLERFHDSAGGPPDLDQVWPYLSSDDRHIRYAARIAVEHQPLGQWQPRALSARGTNEIIQAALAWARSPQLGDPAPVLELLDALNESQMSNEQLLDALRVVEVVLARANSAEITEELRQTAVDRLSPLYPAADARLNRELCELLVYLRATDVVGKTLNLLAQAASNGERIQYLLRLRCAGLVWTLDQRREYLRWFSDAAANAGGNSYAGFVKNILNEALEDLAPGEQQQLESEIAAALQPAPQEQYAPRSFIKHWTVDEVLQDRGHRGNAPRHRARSAAVRRGSMLPMSPFPGRRKSTSARLNRSRRSIRSAGFAQVDYRTELIHLRSVPADQL